MLLRSAPTQCSYVVFLHSALSNCSYVILSHRDSTLVLHSLLAYNSDDIDCAPALYYEVLYLVVRIECFDLVLSPTVPSYIVLQSVALLVPVARHSGFLEAKCVLQQPQGQNQGGSKLDGNIAVIAGL